MAITKIEFPITEWTIRYYSRKTPIVMPGKGDRDTYVPKPNSFLARIDIRSKIPVEGVGGHWRGLIYFYPETIHAKNNTPTLVALPKPCLGIPERFGEGFVVLHYYISQLANITDILNTKGVMCFFDGTKSPGEAGIGHGVVGS